MINCGLLSIYLPKLNITISGNETSRNCIRYIKSIDTSHVHKLRLVDNLSILPETIEIVEVRPRKGIISGKFILDPV